MKIYDVLREGVVELNVMRVNIYGPPRDGKTCLKLLLLNEDPPSVPVTDSTLIICPSIRAYSSDETKCKWERVTKEGLIGRVSADLQAKANEEPSDNIFPNVSVEAGVPSKPSEAQGNITDKQQKISTTMKKSLQKILRYGQNYNDVHVKGNWLLILVVNLLFKSCYHCSLGQLLSVLSFLISLSLSMRSLSSHIKSMGKNIIISQHS